MATPYLVFRRADGGDSWSPVTDTPVVAQDDRQAIRAATKDSKHERSGTFVAVPTRSFRPRTRTVETKEIDRWA